MIKSRYGKLALRIQQTMTSIENLKNEFDEINEILLMFKEKVDKVQSGDDLLPGVLKMVKVFVAVKRNYNPVTKWLEDMETRV